MTSPFVQPNYVAQFGTPYKTNLDNAIAVFLRMAGAFSPQAQDTPDMTVHVNAGHVFDGSTLTEVAAQDTGSITAPSTDDRIDRVVIAESDGSVSVITGTEAASPSAPSITSGNLPCAKIYLTPSTTEITNSDITDERSDTPDGGRFVTSGGGNFPNVALDVTATDEQMNAVLTPYATATVELGGDFDAGEEVRCERIGNWVTITSIGGGLQHSATAAPSSANGAIPSQFLPSESIKNVYHTDSNSVESVQIRPTTAKLFLEYFNWDGSQNSKSSANWQFAITYLIT